MDIANLRNHLEAVLPILSANLSQAHAEYIAGDLSAGAFEYVRSRHATALAVLAMPDVCPASAYKACAALAIDLSSGLKDVPNREEAQQRVNAWWDYYRKAGFTEISPHFQIPCLPNSQ